MDEITLQRKADEIVRQNVNCCLSSLVSTLASGVDALRPAQRHPRRDEVADLADLTEQAVFLAAPVEDYEEAARQRGWTKAPEGWWWRQPTDEEREDGRADFYFLGSGPFVRQDSAADACEWDDEPPYEWEVFEFWSISPLLAAKLEAAGEKVDRDFAGLCVWARTTTGQAIGMDGVIRRIVTGLHKEV